MNQRLGSVTVVALAALAVGCARTDTSGEPLVMDGIGGTTSETLCASGAAGGGEPGGVPISPTIGVFGSSFQPVLGTTYSQAVAPPAVSGGTLLVLADGKTAVAADPDRDSVYIADLASRTLKFNIALSPGDEPGRVIEDGAGRVHITLRHGGALLTCDPTTGAVLARRSVCPAPRGLAYDPATGLVHVACHDGQLISLPAAGGAAVRTLQLDSDLRDVVVSGSTLLVSRFRTAELLTVASDGTVSSRVGLPAFASPSARSGSLFTASVAWRTLPMPGGGVAMLHQRGLVDPVQPVAGGYGGLSACDAIVHPAITTISPEGVTQSGPALAGLVLAVDMAIAPDGKRVAVISTGNSTNTIMGQPDATPALTRVFVSDLTSTTDSTIGCSPDGVHAPCQATPFATGGVSGTAGRSGTGGFLDFGGDGGSTGAGGSFDGGTAGSAASMSAGSSTGTASGTGVGTGAGAAVGGAGATGGVGGTSTGDAGFSGSMNIAADAGVLVLPISPPACGNPDPTIPPVVGQPIAVAFDGAGNIVVQSREPAMLAFADGNNLTLSTTSRADTGHTLFHANSGGFLACGSCHAEGNEDGRTWNFTCEGTRRTQSVQTGLRGTEPFHWGGDEKDFSQLMTDVFVGRMSGPTLSSDQGDALLSWLDAQPRAPEAIPTDPAAVTRGQTLFRDPMHGCATCHVGPRFTNNRTVDVGTGGLFQVPSLIGVGSRGPYLHNGCAATLTDRFGPCGGGDLHGVTSNLSADQIADLVAYLNTI